MPIRKPLPIFFTTCIFILTFNLSYSQVEDSTYTNKDTIGANIEEIQLGAMIFQENKRTLELINQISALTFCDLDSVNMAQDIPQEELKYSNDHWVSDRVNPYRDVKLPTPFKIEFDQAYFTHPVDGKIVVTSRFGRRRRGYHRGLDLDLVTGDTVRSVLPGKVRFVGYSRGHGKTVLVRHANDVETLYAHLSGFAVDTNDIVTEGQAIGLGGNTGNSRGSHLHLEVRYKGICIHPEYVFDFSGNKEIRNSELWVSNMWKSPRFHSSYRRSKLEPLCTEEDAVVAQKAEPRYHRVRSGDTLSEIAQRYRVGLREICSLNAISVNSTLRIGQTIQVR